MQPSNVSGHDAATSEAYRQIIAGNATLASDLTFMGGIARNVVGNKPIHGIRRVDLAKSSAPEPHTFVDRHASMQVHTGDEP